MNWLTVVKTWIWNLIRMMFSFLKKDNKTIDNKEHIKSVVESLGQFKGKTYQIAFRKDLSDYVYKQPKEYKQRAKRIVEMVFAENTPDTTGGAIWFENVEKYGQPSWVKFGRAIRTCKIGEHTFWREKKVK